MANSYMTSIIFGQGQKLIAINNKPDDFQILRHKSFSGSPQASSKDHSPPHL
jgi:hypothetical protein